MPTHDSAILTRRLSCAHFRARWASLAARSARFCCRWIWTIRATLYFHVSMAWYLHMHSVSSIGLSKGVNIRIQAPLVLTQKLQRGLRLARPLQDDSYAKLHRQILLPMLR